MKTGATLTKQALQMPIHQRAQLAHTLIQSLDTASDSDRDQLWEAEISRRVDDIRKGRVQGIPASQVLARRPHRAV
jgi:putative addiction module component (TIGR02574 family)